MKLWQQGLLLFGIPIFLLVGAISVFAVPQEPEVLPTTYTSTSETNCVMLNSSYKQCSTTQYSFKTFADNKGNTINNITNIKWLGNSFNFSHNSGKVWVEIQPFAIYNGQYKTFQDLKTAFPNINIRNYISHNRFGQKFGVDLENLDQAPPELLQNTEYLGYRLISSGGLTWDDVHIRDGMLIIKDKYEINFGDLKDIGYDLTLINKTYLLIGNLSNGYSNGTLSLDPTITLNSGNMTDWGEVSEGSRGSNRRGFHVLWDITAIPEGATIINATECFQDASTELGGIPDSDLNLTKIDNSSFNGLSWNIYTGSLINQTSDELWFTPDGSPLARHNVWCANITKQFVQSYGNWNNVSMRHTDLDGTPLVNTSGVVSKGQKLTFGSAGFNILFASPQNSNTTARPYMVVVFESEAVDPEVMLFYPEDTIWMDAFTPASGSQMNFTCQGNDSSTLDIATLYSDFRNGSWHIENTFLGDETPPFNYTTLANLSTYFYSRNEASQNLSSINFRRLTANTTHGFTTGVGDELWVYLRATGENVSTNDLPDSWITGLDENSTHLAMVDIVSSTLYLTNKTGGEISSCVLGGSGLEYGVSFDVDNTTVWILNDDGATTRLQHTNFACADLGFLGGIPTANPDSLIIRQNLSFIYNKDTSPDSIMVWNMTSNTSYEDEIVINPVISNDMGTPSGIWVARNDILHEEIFVAHPGGDRLGVSVIKRFINSTDITWNCEVCDVFNNCAFAPANFTFRVTNDTAAADTCTYSGSGQWDVNCGDGCVIEADVNVQKNIINFTGAGLFNISARIFNQSEVIGKTCELVIYSGGSLG